MRQNRRQIAVLALLLSVLSGSPVWARGEPTSAGDVCALMLKVESVITDSTGTPLQGAELWRVHEPKLKPPEPTRAQLLGRTNSHGQVNVPECYMGASDWQFWDPATDPVRLVFMIVREGYGVERVLLEPRTAEVLAAGNVIGVPPGKAFQLSQLRPDPHRRKRGYVVPLKLALRPIRS